MNCFKTPQHTNTRRVKNVLLQFHQTIQGMMKIHQIPRSHNVKRKLVFEDDEENAFIKLNDVCNSTQINGYSGRSTKPNTIVKLVKCVRKELYISYHDHFFQ